MPILCAHRSVAALGLAVAIVAAGCGQPGASASTSPATSPDASRPASPSLTPVPDGTSPTPAIDPTPATTTETDWGVILDALPVGFPVYPGAVEAPPREGAASGAFSIPAGGEMTTDWYQAALEMAGYSTLALSGPFEDGSTVIESVGPRSEACRARTTITPLSGTTFVTILVDAACAD